MTQNLVSTQEVATMLQVAETTVKRWADESLLLCVRTPGGHRKFRLADIARFAEERGLAIRGSEPPPMTPKQMEQLQLGVYTKDYARIATVFKEEALQADCEGLFTLLMYLYRQHLPLPLILDNVVRPAFEVIGREWEEGNLEVGREHAATQAVTDALVRMSAEVYRKDANKKAALCACPEGELHELGLRGLAYSLQAEGWKVHYLGSNTPATSLLSFVREARPELVCISVTTVRHRSALVKNIKRLTSQVHAYKGRVIIGGCYAAKLHDVGAPVDYIGQSIQDAVSYIRDVFHLKPGRKKKLAAKD